jgi:hypothetical protein
MNSNISGIPTIWFNMVRLLGHILKRGVFSAKYS